MPDIPTSSAPAARQWLYDAITAAATPDPDNKSAALLVCIDDPGTYQPDDIVSVGGVTREIGVNSLVGGGGAGWLEERYRITVDVEVYRGGDYPSVVFDRTSALVDVVIAVVRADPSLGGTVLVAKPVTSTYEGSWQEEHEGRLGSATVEIECFQRI